MTGTEPPTRKKSALNDDDDWSAPANPPPATAKPVREVPPVTARTSTPARGIRGHARDIAEARARKKVRDAAYAWAASAHRTAARRDELGAELQAARQHGSDPDVLVGYLTEACERYGLDPATVPQQLRDTTRLDE
ncbi:hypothetical protein [Nocardia goodfellowii]|uniref:Uncharacterized protein n=1 Tax=Nocardia goodfellowii TaxID=882446 RepID=A0ABS4QTN6_9NOCA|nr:hypothetical protein [Nocardia goodfellowii]MBP2194555.1 hypothetical protein [Nocardia goodfellowii]